jgi:hypothetical protein
MNSAFPKEAAKALQVGGQQTKKHEAQHESMRKGFDSVRASKSLRSL